MSKSENTKLKLEEALSRILNGNPCLVPASQKLSVKAVEEEAGLGSGSIYYYKDIVAKIKDYSTKQKTQNNNLNFYESKIKDLKMKLSNETRLKEKYRNEINGLKNKLANMASQHNRLALTIQQYQYKIAELESSQLIKLK